MTATITRPPEKPKITDAIRASRLKRKAGDSQENRGCKRSNGTPRTTAEGDSKYAYISLVLTSEKGKELLGALGHTHGTDVKRRQGDRANRVSDQSLDPMQRDLESTRRAQTYLDALDDQAASINNIDCKVLRNRKVPGIAGKKRRASCATCKDANIPCVGRHRGPCQQCKYEGVDCATESRPQTTGLQTPPDSSSMRSDDGSVIMIDDIEKPGTNTGNPIHLDQGDPKPDNAITHPNGVTRTDLPASEVGRSVWIETAWAHPINFMKTNTKTSCRFCSDPHFAAKGFGLRMVEVVYCPEERGYIELGNGHRADGRLPTEMCVVCALSRLRVIHCRKHRLEVLPGIDLKSLAVEDWLKYANALGSPRVKIEGKMCSICVMPAEFRCCNLQRMMLNGDDDVPASQVEKGCGAVFCRNCRRVLERHGGLLRQTYMRQYLEDKHKADADEFVRADAEFLYPSSLLRKAYTRMNGSIQGGRFVSGA